MQGTVSSRRTLLKTLHLNPGTYIVCAKTDYDKNVEKDFDVNLAVYGDYACKVELATRQQASMLAGHEVDWEGVDHN